MAFLLINSRISCQMHFENSTTSNWRKKRAAMRATFITRIDNAMELLVAVSSFVTILPSPQHLLARLNDRMPWSLQQERFAWLLYILSASNLSSHNRSDILQLLYRFTSSGNPFLCLRDTYGLIVIWVFLNLFQQFPVGVFILFLNHQESQCCAALRAYPYYSGKAQDILAIYPKNVSWYSLLKKIFDSSEFRQFNACK